MSARPRQRRRDPPGVGGLLLVDKPPGPTSFDVVAAARRALGLRRVGHAGTLDPFASGLLVVCAGAAARLVRWVQAGTKTYEALVHLGVETDSGDSTGQVVSRGDPSAVDRDRVEVALGALRGAIRQRPPAHSAVKVAGRRAYSYARAGEPVDVPERTVVVHALEITQWKPPWVGLRVECSSGTYVRSLAIDLGRALGCGATLEQLRRTRSGHFDVCDAVGFEALRAAQPGSWRERLLPMRTAVAGLPAIRLDEGAWQCVARGQRIETGDVADPTLEYAALVGPDGELVAVAERSGEGGWQPRVVVRPVPAGGHPKSSGRPCTEGVEPGEDAGSQGNPGGGVLGVR